MTKELKIFKHPSWRTEHEFLGLVAPFEERKKAVKELVGKVNILENFAKKVYLDRNSGDSYSCIAYDLTNKELANIGHQPSNHYETADEFVAAVLGTTLIGVKSNKCICDDKAMFYGGCKCGAFQRELEEEGTY